MNKSTAKQNEDKVQTLFNNYCSNLNIDNHPKEGNKEIFNTLKPDGWFIDELQSTLFIFECKCKKSQWVTEAKQQLKTYLTVATDFANEHDLEIKPVFIYGETKKTFTMLYVADIDNDEFIDFNEIYKPLQIPQQDKFEPKEFNEYIYANFPKISSNERMLLVVGVLLTKYTLPPEQLKPPLFQRVLEVESNYNMKHYFKFISQQPYIKCVDKMFQYLSHTSKENILQNLYACFVEVSVYSFKGIKGNENRKQTTQTEGAVLTPPDIVKLMTNSLNIKPGDVVCDPCCGTANFLIESLSHTTQLIGNELDITRSIISKHGLIISGVERFNITNVDCMKNDYKPTFDYLLMNPPYDHGLEQEFCLKFIELARKGGAVIIPINNFQQEDFKQKLLKICTPRKLIVCNNNLFYPTINSLDVVIFVFTKNSDDKFELFDFRDDGSVTLRANNRLERIIVDNTKQPVFNKFIMPTEDKWRLSLPVDYTDKEFKHKWIDYINDVYNAQLVTCFNYVKLNSPDSLSLIRTINFNSNWINYEYDKSTQFKLTQYVISDLLTYVGHGKSKTKNQLENGLFPLISRSSFNHGIIRFVEYFDFEPTDDNVYVTIAGGGGTGDCFIQTNKFAATSCTSVFKVKEDLLHLSLQSLRIIAYIITCKLKLNYNRNNNLNIETILNETVELPDKLTDDNLAKLVFD